MPDDTIAVATSAQKDRVRSFFDESTSWQGDFYEKKNEYFSRLIQRRKRYGTAMLQGIPGGKHRTALDVGCGAGAYLEELVTMGYRATGMDLSPEMLESCRKRFDRKGFASSPVELCHGDIEHLPFQDHQFDLVLCIGVLGYLLTDEKALAEIMRVLKPGGHLLLNVTNLYSLSDIDFHIRKKAISLLTFGRKNGRSPGDLGYAAQSDWMLKNRQYANKSYRIRPFERMLSRLGLRRLDAMTFGFEFRLVRRLHVIPRPLLDRTELVMESLFRKLPLPYFSRSGWGYLGLFQKS
ncbi:MAG: Methyltransferase type 11 [Bacteroidetes bacterium]|nr:Methyltransferase type 11 [Bacteroidota bacterium]